MEEGLGNVLVCEPNLRAHKHFQLCGLDSVIENSDIIVILVDHQPFKKITASALKEKVVIDTRGIVR
jgi:UDP-N-acetyl-D-mannosaminuronic acid dehydrogenase